MQSRNSLLESSSGQSKLNSLKNTIARDVMQVVKGVLPQKSEIYEDSGSDLAVIIRDYYCFI